MNKYSVEEVRDAANRTVGIVSAMLTAYAERIEADESAGPVAQGEADELISAYDEAVRRQRESGFQPPAAQQAARACVEHNRNRLRKVLAGQPRAVPDGWLLVPREPTPEQVIAMMKAADESDGLGPREVEFLDIYTAGTAAAPSPGELA